LKENVINLGGEGEVFGAINVNDSTILAPNWRCARTGCPLKKIQRSGLVVACHGDQLPFCNCCADKIITNNVPIDIITWMGPAYSTKEIKRIAKQEDSIPPLNTQNLIYFLPPGATI